jgi:hypothetical protein
VAQRQNENSTAEKACNAHANGKIRAFRATLGRRLSGGGEAAVIIF